jgi:hypothetical protein
MKEWTVTNIHVVRSLATFYFDDIPTSMVTSCTSGSIDSEIDFYRNYVFKRKEREFKIAKLPISMQIHLENSESESLIIIFRSTTNKLMYELSDNFRICNSPGVIEERFKKAYVIYEELSNNQDSELKDIRHSLSHSSSHLTHQPTIEILLKMFGDKKLNLNSKKHKEILKKKLIELLDNVKALYIREVFKYLDKSKKIGNYYLI